MLAYYLLGFVFINGLAPRSLIAQIKFTIGSVNVFPLDFAFGAMVVLLILAPLLRSMGIASRQRWCRETRAGAILAIVYVVFQVGQVLAGYFSGVPVDALIRMFAANAQPLYLLIPLLYVRTPDELRRLLMAVVLLAMVFPFGQLILTGSDDTARILHTQGTFRLGYGDFNVILAIGFLALIAWERKAVLAALPAIGIVLLAHRSAYIGIVLATMAVSVLKGRNVKTTLLLVVVGGVLAGMLTLFQLMTSSPLVESGIDRASQTFEDTGTTQGRLVAIQNSFTVFADNPLVGMGYRGTYDYQKIVYSSAFAFNVLHPHNFVMSSLSKDGTIGTVLFLWLLGHLLVSSRRLARMPGYRETGAFLFGSMLFFILLALMNTTMGSVGYVIWLLGGSTLWLLNYARNEAKAG